MKPAREQEAAAVGAMFVAGQAQDDIAMRSAPQGVCRTYGARNHAFACPALTRWANVCRASGAEVEQQNGTVGIMVQLRLREWSGGAEAGAFEEGVDGVDRKVSEGLVFAGGPANFELVDFGGFAEAEMEAEIVLREVAAAAAHFADLADAAGVQRDASANRGAIAFRADEL
jgi:hypothetical protein